MRPSSAILAATVALVGAGRPADTEMEVELRAATTGYRFFDVTLTLDSRLVLDALYVSVSGVKEMYLGAGYDLEPARGVSVTPMLYVVLGNEGRGVTLGGLVFVDRRQWRILGFIGHFFRTGGDVSDYKFVDALDVTRVIGRWEVGGSVDAYEVEGEIGWRLGPTLKRNDSLGGWALSARFGDRTELRLTRTLAF